MAPDSPRPEVLPGDADGVRGWTARIARNRALDHLRAAGRRPISAVGVEELLDRPAGEDTAEEAVTALGTGRALAAIASLPRDQAEAVLLRVVMGLDAKSAAEVLGKRPGATRMATSRGCAGWLNCWNPTGARHV